MHFWLIRRPFLCTAIYFVVIGWLYWLMLVAGETPRLVPCLLILGFISVTHFWLSCLLLRRNAYNMGLLVNHLLFTLVSMAGVLLCYATLYRLGGLRCTVTDLRPDAALDSLYFSGVTWTTLGYGDFVPGSRLSRFFAVLEAIQSYIFQGVFIALLLQMLTHGQTRPPTPSLSGELRKHE